MRMLFNVSDVEVNVVTFAIVEAFVRRGGELPDLYAEMSSVARIRKFLAEKFPHVKWRFFVAQPDPYADLLAWAQRGVSLRTAKGGLAVRLCSKSVSFGCRILTFLFKMFSNRSARKNSLLAKYDSYLTVYRAPSAAIEKSGLKIISVLPNPAAMKFPQKFLNDSKYDWMRARFKNLTANDFVIPAHDTCKEDMLVYGPGLSAENVMEVACEGAGLETWADGVVNMRPVPRSYYVNNWHNNAPRVEVPRILLVGDIAVMRFRDRLVRKYNVPVDGFSTSLKMDDARFMSQLKTFLYAHPYAYSKAVLMVGNHIAMKPAVDMATFRQVKDLVKCETILASPLPFHMQEKKYVGNVNATVVDQHRNYLAMMASRLGWRFIDVCQYVMEAEHSEVSTSFCAGFSHVGMSHALRPAEKTVAKEIMDEATALFGMALDIKKDDGPDQKAVYEEFLKAGKIAPGEAKLEFEEWETLTIDENKHCRYFFVGGCLLRDCCAASAKLKCNPTAEVYTSSHSIADPAYIEGLKCMMKGKTYDAAYFNFGAHFFLHTREEFTKAFKEILSILKKHASKVVLITLPELASTGEADREECDFKNEKIRWANNQLLTVYSKEYTVVPVHQMVLKYAAQRRDYFHFERNVYDLLFKEIQEQVGEPVE